MHRNSRDFPQKPRLMSQQFATSATIPTLLRRRWLLFRYRSTKRRCDRRQNTQHCAVGAVNTLPPPPLSKVRHRRKRIRFMHLLNRRQCRTLCVHSCGKMNLPSREKRALHAELMNRMVTRTPHTIPKCKWQIIHLQSAPLCDIPSGCCFFTGPWTVTRPSLRMLRRVAAFWRPLRPVLLLVSFPRSRSPVVGVPGLCRLRRVPFVC